MALLDTIPGVEDFIRNRIEQGATHKVLSDELKALYPLISRGLSSRSIRRFCEAHDIHSSSRLSDVQLDTVVRTSIHKVSHLYTDVAFLAYAMALIEHPLRMRVNLMFGNVARPSYRYFI